MAAFCGTFEQKPFVPSEEKAKAIAAEVDKTNDQKEKGDKDQDEVKDGKDGKGDEDTADDEKDNAQLKAQVKDAMFRLIANKATTQIDSKGTVSNSELKVEEFEKDEDENCHVDLIYSMANIRAANYSLEPMDWITVKIKAGRIVPALATTTAAIAGL